LGLPLSSIPSATAPDRFGVLTDFVGINNPISSAQTREQLGWAPEHPNLLDDLKQPHYWTK
jgi:hypothetical protein